MLQWENSKLEWINQILLIINLSGDVLVQVNVKQKEKGYDCMSNLILNLFLISFIQQSFTREIEIATGLHNEVVQHRVDRGQCQGWGFGWFVS